MSVNVPESAGTGAKEDAKDCGCGMGDLCQADDLPRSTPCGFCEGGIIRNHPSNGEDGWCPYCNGTGWA